MPNGTITPSVSTVTHSMLLRSRKKLIMASIMSNAFQAWVFATDRVEFESGGYQISNPLVVGNNPNVGTYKYYSPVPVGQTDEFATVEYGWSRFAGTVIISDQEQDENQGDGKIFDILKGKMKVLERSIKEKFSEYLYAAGGGDDPLGLASLIPTNPNTGTLGGINRATQAQWRTSAYIYAGAIDSTNIEEAFDDVLLDLTVGTDKPSLILIGRDLLRSYRQAVRDKITIPLTAGKAGQRMFDLGFTGVMHNNTTILYDERCPVNYAYFINDEFLRLHVLKHVNMVPKKLVAPWDTDAEGSRIVWQGQYCLWKAFRTHAVMTN